MKPLTRIILGAALILMVAHAIIYVVFAINLAQFPFDYDQGEGFELHDTVLLSEGQWPYRDNAVYPFYASNYPPLYHVLLIPFVWLFGPQYWYGRLAGFAATLITAAAIGYAVQRATRQRVIAALAGLAFLASNYVYHTSPLFRQHATMVMFETLAIVAAGLMFGRVRGPDEARFTSPPSPSPSSRRGGSEPLDRRALIIALIALMAAGFTKQLAVATVGAFFAYFFVRAPRRALGYAIGFAVVAGLIFLAINVSTGGQWWLNIITANVNLYIPSQFTDLAQQFVGLHGALLILAGLYTLYELYFARLSIYTIWFAFAAIDAVLAGKWGAGDSYFTTLIAAMCILAGLFVGHLVARDWTIANNYWSRAFTRLESRARRSLPIGLITAAAMLMFVFYGLAVVHVPLNVPVFKTVTDVLHIQSNTKFPAFYDSAGWVAGYALLGQLPTAEDTANGWQITEALRGSRLVLSEDSAFALQAGKAIIGNPTQLKNLYENQHLDPSALVAMIRTQQFGVVIFRAPFYPQPVIEAVYAAYQVTATIPMNGNTYQIMTPRPGYVF